MKEQPFSFLLTFTLLLTFFLGQVSAAEDFPLRIKYPDVKIMSTDELAKSFDNVIVVDVRSKMEFDVAHINGAQHVTVAIKTFPALLEKVRSKMGSQPLAFYCNGHTCAKSYKAYMHAADAGFKNIFAYDAGIFDWIMAYPEKATLMGETPAKKDKIIPKGELANRFLGYDQFKAGAESPDSVVIDIREPFQRKHIPEIRLLRNIPLDRLLGLLKKKELQGNSLYFMDAVGKQVRWLQYHLVENGYTNYYFLKKGAAGT